MKYVQNIPTAARSVHTAVGIIFNVVIQFNVMRMLVKE